MSDVKEVENEIVEGTPDKKSRVKTRMASMERNSASPIGKIMIRQSTDSPQSNYEIITSKSDTADERNLVLSPQVKLHRYEVPVQSPKEKALNNGLDPMALELISSAHMATPKAASEYSDKSDESLSTQKISREMKNLQKSTNDSKILSNYLNSSLESPRSRRKVLPEPAQVDPLDVPAPEEEVVEEAAAEVAEEVAEEEKEDEEEEEEEDPKEQENEETEIDEENENDKEMQESAESDSTLVLHPMEPPEKRRKSVPRSRSRSRNVMRGRKKSIARQLKDELNVTSDKDEMMDDDDDDMSEVSFVSNPSLEGRSVKPPPKAGWDSFCFKCHTDTAVLSLACYKCKCSYHRHCVRPNPIPKNVESFVCPECLEVDTAESSPLNKYGHERIDMHTLAEMLTIILEKIRTYPDRDHFEADIVVKCIKEPSLPLIVTQMSLKTIESRIKMRHYKVSEAFIHDVKQLEHNWNIVDRSKSKTLKTILKYVVTEINELEACVYCYEESFVSGDWFIHPCKRPHLLIWAKLKGYPFWPAKVMSIDARQQVDVRFFGAHDRAWVPSVHCMLFSEKDPNKSKGATPTSNKNISKTQKGIADAMKEKDGYIDNLRAKFGFKYAPFKQQLDPNNLQGQLETMLPNLNNAKDGEKEADGAQKKLTLKIIKGQSSNYQVEHKSSEPRTPSVKDKPSLYKVLSKNDDNTKEVDGKLHPLIIKRKSNVEQEVERAKRSRTGSETSESNASVQSAKIGNIQRRKSTREPPKSRKALRNLEPPAKKKNSEKNHKDEIEVTSVDESTKLKLMRKRTKSVMPNVEEPLLVSLVVPPGTNEIQKLKESSPEPSPATMRTKKRSQSFNRLNEKEPEKDSKEIRRKSISISSPIKRSMSTNEAAIEAKAAAEHLPVPEKPVEDPFNPDLVIKDEPMSEGEEGTEQDEQNAFTLNDLPELMQDKSGKKKLIVISTNEENGESSSASTVNTRGRAKKSFPNPINQRQLDQLGNGRTGNWMVCIPQAQVAQAQSQPPSNRSTPASESHVSIVQLRSNATSTPNSVSSLPSTSNRADSSRVFNVNPVPPLSYVANLNNQRRNSVQTNVSNHVVNGQHRRQSVFSQQSLPRLAPAPRGVFTYDGANFHRDTGPVSRMFSDNAHRVTDFFRNVLIETVTAFAPDNPSAENLMLRSENEKLQREMQTTKSDCQQKMQELRREHQDEIESLKRHYEERIVNLQIQADQEKSKLIKEIRQQCESDKQRAVENTRKETKKTTWCSNCTKEARFYCCWNTSYCGQQCQKTHWQIHQKYCTNKNSTTEIQQQQQAAMQQAQAQAQAVNDSQMMPVPVSRLVIRSPQHLQQSVSIQQSQLQPPVSIQQQIILPQRTQTLAFPVLNVNQIPTNQIIIGQQPFKNNPRVIQTIYPEKMPQSSPTSLMVQTIQRNDSPNINVISTQPDPLTIRVNNVMTSVTSTPISQE